MYKKKQSHDTMAEPERLSLEEQNHSGRYQDEALFEDAVTQRLEGFKKKPLSAFPGRMRSSILRAVVVCVLLAGTSVILWPYLNSVHTISVYQVGNLDTVSQDIGGGGIVYPRQQLDLSYPVAERVIDVLVKPGDQVKPDQPLIKLDPAQVNAEVTQAANDVAAAQAYLNSVSATGNPVTIAQAQQAYQLAQNRYNALVAQTSSPTFHNGTMVSPMNGIVSAVHVNPGEIFTAGTVLLTLMDESTVIVRTKIPLVNMNVVHIGLPCLVIPSALPSLTLNGTVASIIPQADAQSDTFEVWVQIPNPSLEIVAGMGTFVRIQAQEPAFIVPRSTILDTSNGSVVFIVRNGHVHKQPVHVVTRTIESVYVDAGLGTGDQLALTSLDKLQDTQQVSIKSVEH